MKISYVVTACNESEELSSLLNILSQHIEKNEREDEIVLQIDKTNHTDKVRFLAEKYSDKPYFSSSFVEFSNNDFSAFKNSAIEKATGEWVFFIDADEEPSSMLLEYLEDILEVNGTSDLIYVPRANYVLGVMDKNYVASEGWVVDSEGRINYPDYQPRIFKNKTDKIHYKGDVHETIVGVENYSRLPHDSSLYLTHNKHYYRQINQNAKYLGIQTEQKLKSMGMWFGYKRTSINGFAIEKWTHPSQGDWDKNWFTDTNLSFYKSLLKTSDGEPRTVIDIGAQSGNMTMMYAYALNEKYDSIYSFEPNPAAYSVLEANSRIGLVKTKINTSRLACSDRFSIETFHYSDTALCNGGFASETDHGIGVTGHVHPLRTYCVDTGTYLRYILDDSPILLLKVDAEGHDRYILKSTFASGVKPSIIITEIYDGLSIQERKDLFEQLRKNDYVVYNLDDAESNNISDVRYFLTNKPELSGVEELDVKSGHNLVAFTKEKVAELTK